MINSFVNLYPHPMFEYKNINEYILEVLLSKNQLDIIESDSHSLIDDAICLTLNQIKPHYIRHHIDYAYSLSEQDRQRKYTNIVKIFNVNILKIRNSDHSEWDA